MSRKSQTEWLNCQENHKMNDYNVKKSTNKTECLKCPEKHKQSAKAGINCSVLSSIHN